jgi:hypothetical protein
MLLTNSSPPRKDKMPSQKDLDICAVLEDISEVMKKDSLQRIFSFNNLSFNDFLTYFLNHNIPKERYNLFFEKMVLLWQESSTLFQSDIRTIIENPSNEIKNTAFTVILSQPNLLTKEILSTLSKDHVKALIKFFNVLYLHEAIEGDIFYKFLFLLKEQGYGLHAAFFLQDFEKKFNLLKPSSQNSILQKFEKHLPLLSLFLQLLRKQTLLGKDSFSIKLLESILFEARGANTNQTELEEKLASHPEIWENIKSLLAEVVCSFEEGHLSLEYFIKCLRGLDAYVNNISRLPTKAEQSIRRERIRDILFIFHENLPFEPYPEELPEEQNKILSKKAEITLKTKIQVWRAHHQIAKEQNTKIMSLFNNDNKNYENFCALLRGYIAEIHPITEDQQHPENSFIFPDVHLKDSFPRMFAMHSKQLMSHLTSSNKNTIEDLLRGISDVDMQKKLELTYIEKKQAHPFEQIASPIIFNWLSKNLEDNDFYQFLDQNLKVFTTINSEVSLSTQSSNDYKAEETYYFFTALNLYTEQLCPTIEDDANLSEAERKKSIEAQSYKAKQENRQRANILLEISQNSSVCEKFADIICSVNFDKLPKKNIREKLYVLFKLYESSEVFRVKLQEAPEGTLGFVIYQQYHNIDNRSTPSGSIGDGLNESTSYGSLLAPGSPTTTISKSFSQSDSPDNTNVHTQQPLHLSHSVDSVVSLASYSNSSSLKFMNCSPVLSSPEEISTKVIGILHKTIPDNTESIQQILSDIDSHLSYLPLPPSTSISKAPSENILSNFFSSKQKRADRKERKGIHDRQVQIIESINEKNENRGKALELLAANSDFCTNFVKLVSKIPALSTLDGIKNDCTIKINNHCFQQTSLYTLYQLATNPYIKHQPEFG